jgi:hypothetical protein
MGVIVTGDLIIAGVVMNADKLIAGVMESIKIRDKD